ncbi:MAG: helix-turn-helix transcriptional regulator [Bacteroidota bacterium]|nr:helix-turn-helix transcriptional regulator [Bacteroidota bacterium]
MKDRILQIIEAEELTAAKFAQEIGVQPSSISHIVSGRNKASVDLITKILRRFPGISTDWLMLGKGDMYKSDMNINHAASGETFDSAPDLFNQPPKQQTQNTEHSLSGGTQWRRKTRNTKPTDQQYSDHISRPEQASGANHHNKAVEKILVFYADKTFSAYFPE